MSDEIHADAKRVLTFWFEEHGPKDWFSGEAAFDKEVVAAFSDVQAAATKCEKWEWRATPKGRLAEIIVLDQFSRQIFRNDPRAFASDPLALALAQEAVRAGDDAKLTESERVFVYMPYMHSESLVVHDEAMRLFTALGNADNLEYEKKHRELIARFGRYPKRNAALGRASTPEEEAYIANSEGMF